MNKFFKWGGLILAIWNFIDLIRYCIGAYNPSGFSIGCNMFIVSVFFLGMFVQNADT